jgi:hypothetical protein
MHFASSYQFTKILCGCLMMMYVAYYYLYPRFRNVNTAVAWFDMRLPQSTNASKRSNFVCSLTCALPVAMSKQFIARQAQIRRSVRKEASQRPRCLALFQGRLRQVWVPLWRHDVKQEGRWRQGRPLSHCECSRNESFNITRVRCSNAMMNQS